MSNVSANYSDLTQSATSVVPAPVLVVCAVMLGLAVLCALIRLLRGPATADRIVAVDLLASLVMAGLLLDGIASGNPYSIQAVLGFAVALFLGTVALAKYLDHPENHDDS